MVSELVVVLCVFVLQSVIHAECRPETSASMSWPPRTRHPLRLVSEQKAL